MQVDLHAGHYLRDCFNAQFHFPTNRIEAENVKEHPHLIIMISTVKTTYNRSKLVFIL